jgi:hypothetical protein
MLSDKRRLLRDEESKLHEIERKFRDKQFHERTIAERLKHEYEDLRQRFEQMAFELRFSIEDELKIYGRLLDELMKKSAVTSTSTVTTQQAAPTSGTAYTTISSTIRSGGIEDHDAPSSYQQTRTTSSSGGIGNVLFDLGSSNPITTDLGGSSYRVDDHDTHGLSSITGTSTYSHLD